MKMVVVTQETGCARKARIASCSWRPARSSKIHKLQTFSKAAIGTRTAIPLAHPYALNLFEDKYMEHIRIRPFNTKDTYPEQSLNNDLAQAVVAGNMVFLRGQIGQDLDTRESVGIGSAAAQTEKAMANVKMLLEEAGSKLEDICKVTVYLTDVRYREAVYRVMGRWLKGVHAVSTGLTVTALARPEWLVEIDVIAVKS